MSAGQDITTGPGGNGSAAGNPAADHPGCSQSCLSSHQSDAQRYSRPATGIRAHLTIAGAGTLLPTIFGLDQTGAKITAIVDYGANLVCAASGAQVVLIRSMPCTWMMPQHRPVSLRRTTAAQVTADQHWSLLLPRKANLYGHPQRRVLLNACCPSRPRQRLPAFVAEIKGKEDRADLRAARLPHQNGVWFIAWLITQRLQKSINWASFTAAATASGDVMVGSPAEEAHPRPDAEQRAKRHTVDFAAARLHRLRAVVRHGEWGLRRNRHPTAPFSVTRALMKGRRD